MSRASGLGTGAVRGSRRTLRARVTVVAGLAITAGVVGGLLLMYLLQMNSVRRTIDGQLRTYATQIAQSGQSAPWSIPLAPSNLDPNAQAQVIAADGRVLAATRMLAGLPAVYVLPQGSDTPVRQKAADGMIPAEVRVVGVRTTVDGASVTIVAGTPSSLLADVNEQFAHQLLVGVPVILALAAGTVWLVVGRALRPVERIRRAVTDITSADLTRRVPEPGTDDEIGSLARTMNDMLTRLDDSARRQRRFVADASHELRSPLAAIRTTLEVGMAHPDRAPWPAIAERAASQAQRLEDLLQQLLVLAKADDHQLTARRKAVDLARLLEEICTSTTTATATSVRRVQIRLQSPPGIVVVGDPTHLERMFRNVVDNAVRYARGEVTVTVTPAPGAIRVEVDDDGPGIPLEDRERVFNRFVRLDDSRERGTGNSGLGLAIAREIALAHDGRIAIGDNPAGGARVGIDLPPTADEFHRFASSMSSAVPRCHPSSEEIPMSETVTASATRIIDASPAAVWRAETEPQHFEQWFGAKPGSVKADLRTGGTWSAVVTPDGEEIELAGDYVEVVEHRKLVMTIPNGPEYVEVTLTLTDLDGSTEVTSSTPVPPEVRQMAEETAASILAAVAAIAESL